MSQEPFPRIVDQVLNIAGVALHGVVLRQLRPVLERLASALRN